MNILHVTAHLGGGVGKAHAALTAAMPFPARQSFLLLEEPRDRRYAEEIAALGRPVAIAASVDEVALRAAEADIVQFEFWNHPRLIECLARTEFPPMRTVFWCHLTGLVPPSIPPGLIEAADRFVFASPASLEIPAVRGLSRERRERLAVIGSAFGFGAVSVAPIPIPPSALPGISPSRGEIGKARRFPAHPAWSAESTTLDGVAKVVPHPLSPLEGEMPGRAEGGKAPTFDAPICYLGTVDFAKMHPGFFDVIDSLSAEAAVAVWGDVAPDGEVAVRAAAMRHPHRIRFMGHTSDPEAALSRSRIFFYPLQPDYDGMAENALVEAMSRGLVPVVLANPAECAFIRQGQTGFIASSIDECAGILDRLLADPERVSEVGANAREVAESAFTPKRSARQFVELWAGMMGEEKHLHDFRRIAGETPEKRPEPR